MNGPTIILMTATVDPGDYAADVARRDLEVRRNDYRKALRFYMNLKDSRISGVVFCENSGADLAFLDSESLRRDAERPLELIGFEGNSRPSGVHYGYSELGVIDHACRRSRLLSSAGSFFKVTGRLLFENISSLMDRLPDECRFGADFRRAYRREGGAPMRARTELMFFQKEFYLEHFFERRDGMIEKCTHLEQYVPEVILPVREREKGAGLALRWPIECPASGYAASGNIDYGSGSISVKRRIRAVSRRLAPWLWI